MGHIFVTAEDHALGCVPVRGRVLETVVTVGVIEYRTPSAGQGYLAGEFPGGATTVEGVPVSATVRILYRPAADALGDGVLVAEVQSAPVGTWFVPNLNGNLKYDVVGRKEGFNDVIVAGVTPTSMADMVYIAYTGEILTNETFTGALGYLELFGSIPPYAASVVDPLPAGIFPVVNGRRLIIDGTTTDDGVFNSTVRITSSNGATKDVPVKLVVGFKAPANFEAETLEDAGAFSVVLTWVVTNSTQEVLVFKSTTPLNPRSMPTPIATLAGGAVSYTDDDVIEDDVFYYMVASVCEGFTLYSGGVIGVVTTGDPHWDKVVALLHFDGDLTDQKGNAWTGTGTIVPDGRFNSGVNTSAAHIQTPTASWNDLSSGQGDFTVEMFIKQTAPNIASALIAHLFSGNFPFTIAFGKVGTITASNQLYFGHYNGTWIGANSTWEPVSGQWHHIAASRQGATYKLFADGVLIASFTNTAAAAANGSVLYVGRRWDNPPFGSALFQGVIDEFRITKGVARYTENFTPPTEPFPNE